MRCKLQFTIVQNCLGNIQLVITYYYIYRVPATGLSYLTLQDLFEFSVLWREAMPITPNSKRAGDTVIKDKLYTYAYPMNDVFSEILQIGQCSTFD